MLWDQWQKLYDVVQGEMLEAAKAQLTGDMHVVVQYLAAVEVASYGVVR